MLNGRVPGKTEVVDVLKTALRPYTRGCELTSEHLATIDQARKHFEHIKNIFRDDGILQLRGNWQLGGRFHGWKFSNTNVKNAQYFLCIEPDGNGYQTKQGDHSCDEIMPFDKDETPIDGKLFCGSYELP